MKNLKWICILLLFPFFANTQIDVSLQKTLLSPPPFLYGDLISFQLEITNNSNVAVSNIALLETFGCGFTYTGGSISWTPAGNQLTGTVAGPVNPGQSVLVFVDFNLEACLLPDAWLNNASITGYTDALGNNIFNLDTNVSNNSDTAIAPVFDLALRKKIDTPPPYQYEDLLYFEITVFNQGNQAVQNISINDYLPSGVGFSYDPVMNPGWTGVAPTLNRVIPGTLLPGDSLKTGIYLTLKRTNGGVRAWVNYSEIDGAQDVNGGPVFDADSTPGSNSITENNVLPGDPDDDNISGGGPLAGEDEDDHDPAGVDIFDLALTKEQASALSSFSYIQEVDLLITIYNQGNIPATNITITDYLGEALLFLNSPKNIGRNWIYNPVTHTATTTYNKVLLPGQSDTLMLDVIPIQFYTKHDSAWTNWAEISSARNAVNNVVTSDIDSTPDNINGNDAGGRPNSPSDNAINGDASGTPGDAVAATDEDDHDPHKIQIFDLALRKSKITPGTFFNPGEDIVFAITVFNQGNVPAKDIVVSDYIRDGYEFFPGGANTGWTGTASLVKMNIAQVIFPGRDTTIFITLRVKASSIPGAYLNYAEISAARDTLNNNRNDDADSIADDNPNNDNQVLPGTPDDGNVFGNSFIGEDEDDHDVAGIELLCPRPTLTVGIPVCDPGNGTYSVTYYSNVPNVTASSGIVSGNRVSGIQLGTNVVITAQNGADCTQSLTVQSPDNCPGTGGCDYPQLTVGQPVCSGGGFWAVSFSRDIGIIGTTAGTVTGNTIINIPIGTNITVSSSNGFCISRVNVSSPVNCDIPCANSPISISGPVCDPGGVGTYRVNFIINAGSTLTTSGGTLNLGAGTLTGIPSGTSVTLTITTPGCDTRVVTVPAGDCVLCQKPTLTVGIPVCDPGNGTYSVTYYSNVPNVTASSGIVSGNRVSGIQLGTNVVITAQNGADCTQSLTVQSPDNCPGTGGCDYPQLTVGQPVCSGGGFWAVSFSRDIGIIGTTAGTVTGNTIINIPIGTNITVSSSNGFCISRVNVSSPVNCDIPCANSPISISGPVCDPGGVGTYRVNFIINAGSTLTTSGGTLNLGAGTLTGIPSGTSVTLTITTPGCDTRVVTVPAGDCVLCQKPTLTVGIPVCDPGNGTYSVTYYSNVPNVTASSGIVSGNRVSGIQLGTNVVITAQNGADCTQSLTVQSPDNCPGTGGCDYPQLTVGQPVCSGGGFWAVSFSRDIGIIGTTAGTVTGNTIINIPIGTNITVSSSNGFCISRVNVSSPVNCDIPCANSPVSISGPVCDPGGVGTYRVNFIINAGSTLTTSGGTLNLGAGTVTGIPSGTSVTLTITTPGCDTRVVTVPAGDCVLCQKPTLTVGIPVCDPGNGTYSVTYYNNVPNISVNAGSISGSRIINIPIGTNVTITATNGTDCAQSLTVVSPANCPGTGGCTYPKLTVGQPLCNGSTTWSVSFSTDIGTVTSTSGTVSGNSIINIPSGTNITVSATNGLCVSTVQINAPVNCGIPCANSPVSISGPVCETGSGTYRVYFIAEPGTVVTASGGTLGAGVVTGIPTGTNLTLTITTPGCATRVVVVPSGDCQAGNATIGNFVWHDLNGDGQQSVGEPGISGVVIMLMDQSGNMTAQTTSATNGSYTISNILPGTYYLKFSVPSGFQPTFGLIGDPNTDSDITGVFGAGTTGLFTLSSGQVNNNLDAGFFRCATIGEVVWYDTNRNDIRDNPENGINGLRVNLWRNHFGTWVIWDYTVTGHKPGTASDDGWWQFCAPPGQYYVQVIMPPLGLVQALPNRGNNPNRDSDLTNAFGPGTTNSFTVSSGGSKLDIGAGYYPMAIAGNLVWRDDNLNGLQEASEPKISGIVVEAFDADTHQKVGQSVTDNDGVYEIDYLQKKEVYFRFYVPEGFSPTLPNTGEDHLNSDVDHSFGANTTRKISMESGVFNQNIDMGIAFGILPVTWTDVSVSSVSKGHLISWTTGSELNVSHFVVERLCNDDKDFKVLPGSVKAKGFSKSAENYSFTDIDLSESGDYYYRVNQIDFDGKYSYSKIVHIVAGGDNHISIYPNPAFGSATLEVEAMEIATISAALFDSNGQFVMQLANNKSLERGLNQIRMDLSGLPNALYTLKIDMGNRDVIIRKLIIIK
jgi:uncharacterized repeat protein (TIGR01451 family)